MKRYITYHKNNSIFNFLFKGLRFYYFEEMDLYVSRKYPLIYLKEFGESVANVKLYRSKDDSLIPFKEKSFFGVELNQYIVISYKDGTTKSFRLAKIEHGLMEFEQFA